MAGLAAKTAAGGSGMPTRVLGRTGARVSILGFGCGSRFLMYKEEQALEALNRALDLGITYVDTAAEYGDGVSEEWVGKVLKTRRKGIWLATKVEPRKGDDALRAIEASLKRLQTSQVDLLHIHGLAGEDDLKAIEAKDGVLNALYKLRDQKVARFIGVSCHDDPYTLKAALEHNDFDCTQMALNAARVGNRKKFSDPLAECFEAVALPVAQRKKMGITAMKVFAQEKLLGAAPVAKLVRYAFSLPVASAVMGMPKLDHIEENVRMAKSFSPMPQGEMQELSREIAGRHKAALDNFFHNHKDC